MQLEQAVIVALGSNMSEGRASSAQVLEEALGGFSSLGLHVLRRSSWWRSKAWPDPTEPDYINAVALVETSLEPAPLLDVLHGVEATFGRVRSRPNAPRTLDLDLVAYGRRIIAPRDAAGLVLPHPRAAERGFVMGPLAEIAPDWRHPVSGVRALDLAAAATVGADATPLRA